MFVNTKGHYLSSFKLCYLALKVSGIGIQVLKNKVDITKPDSEQR